MTIDILQTGKLLDTCEAALASRYTVHKLHEQPDPAAWLKANGSRIRAIAGGSVDAKLLAQLPNLEIIANFGVGLRQYRRQSRQGGQCARHQHARRAQ
jgi:lactate dehydrogenase-like 2-hydroxyacid dehydrogenase